MTSFDDYMLMVAIGIPIVLVAAANVFLALTGERGTLFWPESGPFGQPAGRPGEAPEEPGSAPE